jgi:hypothetical protein
VLASTAGPAVRAAGYGWRATWTGAFGPGGCQSCLWAQLRTKFGAAGLLQRTGPDGWVRQEGWSCAEWGVAYRPATNASNVTAGQYLAPAAPESCKRACEAAAVERGPAACAGFSYDSARQAIDAAPPPPTAPHTHSLTTA